MFTALQRRGCLAIPLLPDEGTGSQAQNRRCVDMCSAAGEVPPGLTEAVRGPRPTRIAFLAEPIDRPVEDVLGVVLLHVVQRESEHWTAVLPVGSGSYHELRSACCCTGLRTGGLVHVERVDDPHSLRSPAVDGVEHRVDGRDAALYSPTLACSIVSGG